MGLFGRKKKKKTIQEINEDNKKNCINCNKKFGFRAKKYSKEEIQIHIYILKNELPYESNAVDKSEYEAITNSMINKMNKGKICDNCLTQHNLDSYPVFFYRFLIKNNTHQWIVKYNKSHPRLKNSYNEELERLENKPVTCYWCKKLTLPFKSLQKNVFSLDKNFGVNLKECADCQNIRIQLTSEKLTKLKRKLASCKIKTAQLKKIQRKRWREKTDTEFSAGVDMFSSLLSNRASSSELEFYKSQSDINYSDIEEKVKEAYNQEYDVEEEIMDEEKNLMSVPHGKLQMDSQNKKMDETATFVSDLDTKNEMNDDPLKILKIRLARGEITKEEFKKIKDIL